MAALGLGGYGSDDEEELENAPSGQQQEHEGLLGITLGVQSVQEQEALEPASGSGDAQRGSSEEPEERVEAGRRGARPTGRFSGSPPASWAAQRQASMRRIMW